MKLFLVLVIAAVAYLLFRFFFKGDNSQDHQSMEEMPSFPTTAKKDVVKLRNIFSSVEVKRVEKAKASKLNKGNTVYLEKDGSGSKFPDAISVYTTRRKWLGYIEKDVASEIRESSLLDELQCRVHEVWVGDRGGFKLLINLRGTQSTYERYLEYRISCRKPKESSNPKLVDGYPAHHFLMDIKLYKFRKQWDDLETLLIKLSNAEHNEKPHRRPPNYILELGRLYYKLNRYSEAIPCYEEVIQIYESQNKKPSKTILNQLAKSREKVAKAKESN